MTFDKYASCEVLDISQWKLSNGFRESSPIGSYAYFGNDKDKLLDVANDPSIKSKKLVAVIEYDEFPFVFYEPENYRDRSLKPELTRSRYIVPLDYRKDNIAMEDMFPSPKPGATPFPSFIVVCYPDLTMVEYMTEKLIKEQGYRMAGNMFHDGECYLQPLNKD